MKRYLIALLTLIVSCMLPLTAQCYERTTLHLADLSEGVRVRYYNPDGSCVQLSIGLSGTIQNVPVAARIPFDSEFGSGIRGGSDPSRVASYMDKRHIQVWQVTGTPTIHWIEWGLRNGRFPAIGLTTRHFQTVYGWDEKTDMFYVCNNQTPKTIDIMPRAKFLQLHHQSGEWIVMLKNVSPSNPKIVNWVADLD